jgi:sulfopyruvate decarboxylase TPP-binding subunit
MITKSLAVFGDELFPKEGKGMSTKKREEALFMVTEVFKHTKPELVYLMPSKGTNATIPFICHQLKIPYIIVTPYKGFYNELRSERFIGNALAKCKSFIVVSDSDPQTDKERMSLIKEATDFCAHTALASIFIHSARPTSKFLNFMNEIVDREDIRSWELIYGSG